MTFFLGGVFVILSGGFASLIFGKRPALATFTGVACAIIGGIFAVISAFEVLLTGQVESLKLDWQVPFGSLYIQIDSISAVFLIPILVLSMIAAFYGSEYLRSYSEKKNLGAHWFFYNLLLTGMMLVVVARNGLLFLMAWELMSIASFFLVTFEHEKANVRRAGWIYIVMTHIGTAFLIVFFILVGRHAGSLDFDKASEVPSSLASILFVLAVIGFGTKAGFMPLHVWLPYAHPAAPSHVSAVMSGVMIKTGIYGLVRALTILGTPPVWWGWALVGIGSVSGVLGVLFALAQHDLKRLLAYHSVENIGIITIGLGVGLLGISMNSPALAVLGFAGGLFHVLNHAVFKGLLFLGAGSVLHSTGTGHIDSLGGLIKRMPWTAFAFLIGSIAISGLPPLNGFASEFLIYLGVFKNGMSGGLEGVIPVMIVTGGLALIGGLALACFTKAFGVIFLGHPRTDLANQAHEAGFRMKFSMVLLAALCILLGICSPLIINSSKNVILEITSLSTESIQTELAAASSVMTSVVVVSLILFALIFIFAFVRKLILSSKGLRQSVTWDCGYAKPDSRMQYTAASFAQPLTDLFKYFLRSHKKISSPKGIFPTQAAFESDTDDLIERYLFEPALKWVNLSVSRMRWLQQGRLQIYILYIALTLWILLIWKLM